MINIYRSALSAYHGKVSVYQWVSQWVSVQKFVTWRGYSTGTHRSLDMCSFGTLTSVDVVACVLTKVGKANQGSGKYKRALRDFRKKTHFKLYEDQIATNCSSEGTHFVSSETQEHLFSILILGWRVVFSLILYFLLTNV